MSVARIYSLHLDSFIGPFSKSTILVHWSLKPHWNETFVHTHSSFLVFFVNFPYLTLWHQQNGSIVLYISGATSMNLIASWWSNISLHQAAKIWPCVYWPSKWSCWRYGSQHGGTTEYQKTFAVTNPTSSLKGHTGFTWCIGPPNPHVTINTKDLSRETSKQ